MDKRELRLALKKKLDQRRDLIQQNNELRSGIHREKERNKFLLSTLSNPLVDMALEDCADHIMQAVIEHAVKASEVVADQTIDRGDYEIGISIPSLHIRRVLHREDMRVFDERASVAPYKRVDVDTN